MGRVEGMEILAARLASFELAHPAPKRRTSTAKSAKPLSWPHHSPSPAELAHAGFFFKPSLASPDNTVCFLCGKYLDGWEEDDDPVQEHSKHSPDCGWAIMTGLERLHGEERTNEDPTCSHMAEARRSTFTSVWPHEGKRGWSCKIEKAIFPLGSLVFGFPELTSSPQMVEAGWYFCPTQESDDFVTCAYCNLCLDGWEPKDDPFIEHLDRSSSCRFFNFATKATVKRNRKGRTSKSSRLSTQSNITTTSETRSIPDLDISIDQSGLSDASIANATMPGSKKPRKGSRGKTSIAPTRAKGARTKKNEPTELDSSLMEIDGHDFAPTVVKRHQVGQGTKRTSDEISLGLRGREDRESTVKPQPLAKRRATRNSVAQQRAETSVLEHEYQSGNRAITDNETAKTAVDVKGSARTDGRKRGSSTSRKAPASNPSLQPEFPAEEAVEAALEADLERPLTGDENAEEMPEAQSKQRKQSKVRGSSVSTATGREGQVIVEEDYDEQIEPDDLFERRYRDPASADAQRMPAGRARGSALSMATSVIRRDVKINSSTVTARTMKDDSGHETDASTVSKSAVRKGGRKNAGGVRKGRSKKAARGNSTKGSIIRQDAPASSGDSKLSAENWGKDVAEDLPDLAQSGAPSKPAGGPKTSQSQGARRVRPAAPFRGATAFEESVPNHDAWKSPTNRTSPPLEHTTPSPSPHHSDAENLPPSSRPTASRPPVFSSSTQETLRVHLVPSTPTASPSKRNATGSLQSCLPWKAIDLENVFSITNDDKENGGLDPILTTAEKKMTVEEWVSWNAENGEERLRKECDRLVGIFEDQGGRAMRTLEGVECVEES